MGILGAIAYDPASAVSKATDTRIAMTAFDTTNLRLTFTAPASGKVLVRIQCAVHGATTSPSILLGVLDGSTVKGRIAPAGRIESPLATAFVLREVVFPVTGLTPAASYTWDAAYGVETEVASTAVKYGGPNNTTANDAFGAIIFEIWGL